MNSPRKTIFIINGSASAQSANKSLIDLFARDAKQHYDVVIFDSLKSLPHFDPELSTDNPPAEIIAFRNSVANAAGILICTPEYIFSIPSGLKNALEWCVATTVFSEKPVGLITASASGKKAQEELTLILETLTARVTPETNWLLSGIKGRINQQGEFVNPKDQFDLAEFESRFFTHINSYL